MIDEQTTDRELLERLSQGQREALGELARRYEGPMLGMARGLLGGGGGKGGAGKAEEAARDAVQDVWVRVIKYGKSYRGDSEVKTWLYRILINRCRDLRAAEAKRDALPAAAMLNGTLPRQTQAAEPGGHELSERLHAAVWKLPAATRLLLLLCYHRGLTHEQAAAVLEIPVGTLKSRLHAALSTLRTQLASEVGP